MIKTTTFAIKIVVLLSAAIVAAQSDGPQTSNAQVHTPTASDGKISSGSARTQFDERYPRYRLRASDVMEITFEFTPEFNQTVTVQPDGYISLRGVKDVYVAGKSVSEVTEIVRSMYDQILQNPSVSIVLKDFEKPYVVVGGQVGHPGKFELRGDMTVTEAIAVAGGFSNSAKHSQVVLYRRAGPDLYEAKLINVKKILKTHNLAEDPHLKPGDTLFVPQNTLSKIRQFVPSPGMGVGASF